MSGPDRRRATYQDILDAPPHVAAEIIDGELHLSPRPGLAHASIAAGLAAALAPPDFRIQPEPELRFGGDVLVPALAGWRRERLPGGGAQPDDGVPPDWVCEILSHATEKIDRAQKLPIYGAHGVRHAWLVNATQRFVEVVRLVPEGWLTIAVHRDDDRMRAAPFPAIEIDLAALWEDLAPPAVTSSGRGAAAG